MFTSVYNNVVTQVTRDDVYYITMHYIIRLPNRRDNYSFDSWR